MRLTDQERDELKCVVGKLKGTSQKLKRAWVLLQSNVDGPNWTDERIAEAYGCRTRTVELIRQRLVEHGVEETPNGAAREAAPLPKRLDGRQEAEVVAMRWGPPPSGDANGSLRLLARKVVELSIVETVSHETLRRTLKKT